MATVVIMPRQGQSVESCIITAFNKKVGDTVEKGDVLFSYETDKSSFDEPAPEAGKILAIFREEGDDVPCLENVLVIGQEGEDISAFQPAADAAAPAAEAPAEAAPAAEAPAVAAEAPATTEGIGSISPRARLLAEKTHADLLKAVPTGPNGRIIERDVQKLLDQGLTVSPAARAGYTAAVEGTGMNGKVVLGDLNAPAAPAAPAAEAPVVEAAYEDVKIPNIRKIIAKQMCASLTTMAQLTLNTSFDASKIIALRGSLKAGAEKMGLANITYNDMILFAVSRVVTNYKVLNAHYLNDDTMRYFKNVNLGIAVDTERGLMVPTVFGAEKMSLNDLAKSAKSVIGDAQSGKINPDLLKGATFTVSNLGAMGIESFTPIINPPQTAILGVGGITKRIKEVGGEDVTYSAMSLSLTIDHRAIDGADGARFLKELGFALEHFDLLLTK
ncbi:MAG: 2-oxo acid dehydrogenase subunit E2 [Ruminococcaceae bacterium]|nr:2-oxo acid dehydrogenase subunit E2 [Oscillospiraceae bacterium]